MYLPFTEMLEKWSKFEQKSEINKYLAKALDVRAQIKFILYEQRHLIGTVYTERP